MSRLPIGSDNELLRCLVSLPQCGFCFSFSLECGRNGKIGLSHVVLKKCPLSTDTCVFSSYVYFRLLAVKGGFFAGCVKGEPKAALQKLAGSFL